MGNLNYFFTLLLVLGYLSSSVHSLSCWHCNSNTNGDCAQKPGNINQFGESIECPAEDLCATAVLSDNSTYRDCSSNLPEEVTISESCDTNLCNNQIYPANRLKCHHCSGASCMTVTPGSEIPCRHYVEKDECFTEVIFNDDAVRGCVSDDHDDSDYVRTCEESGCNDQPGVSKFTCVVCDSNDDEGCKTNPTAENDCSITVPGSCEKDVLFGRIEHCFTHRKGEHVIRGCSIDHPELIEETDYVTECILDKCNDQCIDPAQCYVCDSKTNANCAATLTGLTAEVCNVGDISCHTCRDGDSETYRGCGDGPEGAACSACWHDPGCNNKQMLQCYSCTTKTDPNCGQWANPTAIDKVICDGSCIATLREGDVIRGCQSKSFDCQPSITCNRCDEDLCNDGPMPNNARQCYQCDENDSHCNDDQSGMQPLMCPIIEGDDDMCYVFVTPDKKMVRGCSTDLRYQDCQNSPSGKCITCSEDGCNSRPLIEKLTCFECDSNTELSCKVGEINTEGQCVVSPLHFCQVDVEFGGEVEYCYMYHNGGHVLRGCSKNDPEIAEQWQYVKECRTDNCNDECIDSAECYVCDSKTDPNCVALTGLTTETCPATDIACHTCRDGESNIYRGCGDGPEGAECSACWDEPGCNNNQMLECYSCTSVTDPNCEQWTDPTVIDKVICEGNCIATRRGGEVIRGCQSNSFDCTPSASCNRCNEDLCNDGPIADTSRRCYQCDENDSHCNDDQSGTEPTVCAIVESDDDMCYVFVTADKKMVRGCATDGRYDDCRNSPSGKCITCSEDGCNSRPLIEKLTCLKCDSNTELSCKVGEINTEGQCLISVPNSCEADVEFGGELEYCYLYHNGGHVLRGCSKNDPEIAEQWQYVKECRTDNCNDECMDSAECYVCDSKTDPNCVALTGLTTETCPAADIACHTCRDGESNIYRGCGDGPEGAECSACWDEPGCNNKQMLECYSCTSATDPNCDKWTDPTGIEKVICEGNCIATRRDGEVIRGCQSKSFDCEPSASCNRCNEDLCNDGPIADTSRRCYQCDENDSHCNDDQSGAEPTVCAIVESDDDMCYVFVTADKKMVRGCSTDGRYDDCRNSPSGKCITCSEDGCNSQPLIGKLTCLKCDSNTELSCKVGEINTEGQCLISVPNSCEVDVEFGGELEYCYMYHNGGHVLRGCSKNDPEIAEQWQYVKECRTDNCNDECMDSAECYVCDSKTDPNCVALTGLTTETCPAADIACHTCRDGESNIYRGCGDGPEGAECSACWDEPGCNNKQMLECYSCTSATDPNCDKWTDPTGIEKVICEGNCIATRRDGEVIRGCQSKSFDCEPSASCNRCNEDLCNDGPIADTSRRCYQCDENDSHCNDDQSGAEPTVCAIVESDDDMCYVFVTADKKMVRGCSTDGRYDDCRNSPSGKCITCSEDGCNSQPLIGKLTCLKCDSNTELSCKVGEINTEGQCLISVPNSCEVDVEFGGELEYCYMYHNGGHVLRGCSKNDPEIAEQWQYVKECRTDNCNDECMDSAECYVCDSKTDPNCVALTGLMTETCPAADIACHTCRDGESNIYRGCGDGPEGAECSACWDEPGCNNKQMLECYSCTSATDPNCDKWTDPTGIEKVICEGNCIATRRDGEVIRGCQSKSFDCEPSASCNRCNEDLCNDGPIADTSRRCYQCDENDSHCNDDQSGAEPTVCAIVESDDDMCYVFVTADKKMVRGCSTDGRYDDCRNSPSGKCITCSEDGCNSQPLIGKLTCLKCDSNTELSCKVGEINTEGQCLISEPNSCEVDVEFGGELEYCYMYHNGGHVLRGCSKNDPEIAEQWQYVKECRTDNCNDECMDSAECYVCDSKTDPNCVALTGLTTETCPAADIACHTCRDGESNIYRGCGDGPEGAECSACWDEPGCNNKQMLECYSCTSATDPNCDKWTDPTGIEKVICEGNCIATRRDGEVIRGCQSKSFDCEPSASCNRCNEDLCNDGPIADTSRRCYQCDENDSHCNDDQSGAEPTVCAIVESDDDMCYVFVTADKKMVRGCSTDGRYDDCRNSPSGKCITCSEDGCNSQPLIGKLTCLKCDSNTELSCKVGEINTEGQCLISVPNSCEVDVEFGGELEYCYMYHNGGHVLRGCSKNDPEIAEQWQYVKECRTDNCNDECMDSAECYVCDSKTDPNCVALTGLMTETCPAADIACHTCRDGESNIYRGCGDGPEGAECSACWDEPGCNNKQMLECYSCTSATDPNCDKWTDPTGIEKVICEGNCIAARRDGEVIRGCQSNSFDCEPSASCNRCNEDLCNDGPIADTSRRCYQCDENDSQCNDDQSGTEPTVCAIVENDDDMCYVFVTADKKMVRGCATDGRYDDCRNSPSGQCITCSEDGCNSQPLIGKLTCLKCDSNTELSCKVGEINTEGQCLISVPNSCEADVEFGGELEYCYMYHNGGHVLRGCSKNDPEIAEQWQYVKECRTDNCNDECIDSAECYVCDSKTDPNCVALTGLTTETCPATDIACHTCRDGESNIYRGCGDGPEGAECSACWDEPGCNNKQMLECYSCTSATDPNCDKWTDPTGIDKVICEGSCIATHREGEVIRGCQSNSFDCEPSVSCNRCNEDLCNAGPMMDNALRCYQCDESDSHCNADQSGTEPTGCAIVESDNDMCYVFVTADKKMVRGCSTDRRYDDCQNSPAGKCITCSEDGCNSRPLIEKLTCHECDSNTELACKVGEINTEGQCLVSPLRFCEVDVEFGGELEYCYMYRYGEHVMRGCSKNDPEIAEQWQYVKECQTDNCNDECIDTAECYVCDSKNDPNCIDLPGLMAETCPVGDIACHTCRDDESIIYRGCGDGPEGAVCSACWHDPGCNDRPMLQCYSCTSATDPNCEKLTDPTAIDKVICNGNCIATLRDGVVIRGCQSNSFDCQESSTCKNCKEDLCNDGPVPENALRCYQCDENDSICNSDQTSMEAPICAYIEDDEDVCYMFVTNDKKIVRGCSADPRYNECRNRPPGKCITCSGDGCNSQPLIGQLKCLECNSNTDLSCKVGEYNSEGQCLINTLNSCQVDVEFGEHEYCYTYQYAEQVRRGCSQKDTDISAQWQYVKECRTDNCNDECIDSAVCYLCDSKTNPECVKNPFAVADTKCQNGEVSCFTCRDSEKIIRRGCGGGSTFGECYSCWGDARCNNKPMVQCYSCNSRVDQNCADWTNPERINQIVCNGFCIATLRDGFIERGCQSSSFDCPSSETCNRCDEDSCNGGVLPANRILCHQCDETDPNCNSQKNGVAPTACNVYQAQDQCFLFLDDNDKMIRGCTSDDRYRECLENNDRCITCSESGCNSMAAMVAPVLECAKCGGDESCAWAQNVTSRCERDLPYYARETCFTARASDGAITRGCTLDGNSCDSNDPNCLTCSTNGCNTANRIYQSCLQCVGQMVSTCGKGENLTGSECKEIVQPYETRGCFAARRDEIVTRGCLYDLSDEQKNICDANTQYCQTCLTKDCNDKDLSGAGIHSSVFSAMLFAAIAFVVRM